MRCIGFWIFSPLLLCAQTGVQPAFSSLKFPTVESNVVYAYQSVGQILTTGNISTGTLYRSDDGARTWTTLNVAPRGDFQFVEDFALHPERPNLLYAVRSRVRGGFARSIDSGQTWEAINAGLPASGELRDVSLVRMANEEGRVRIGDALYRLDPVGKSWSKLADLPSNTTILAFDSKTAQRGALLAQTNNYFATSDGGATWVMQGRIPSTANLTGLAIAFDPKDSNYLYLRVQADANNQGRCALPSAGLWRSSDGGRTFTIAYDSGFCNTSPNVWVDPVRPNVYLRNNFVSSPYCRSINRGESFSCEQDPGLEQSPRLIAMNPRNGELFRTGLSLQSRDGASSWAPFDARFRPTLYQPAPYAASITEGEAGGVELRIAFVDYTTSTPYQAAPIGNSPWLELTNPTGNINNSSNLNLRINAATLQPGAYTATLRLQSNAATNSPVNLTLNLSVVPRAITGVRYRYQRLATNLSGIRAITRDAQRNIYAMVERRLRRIAPNGTITDIAGDGTQGVTPDNTPAAQAKFSFVNFLAVALDGTIYIAESGSTKLYSLKDGTVRVVMDSNSPSAYRLQEVRGMCVSPSGTIFANDGTRIVKLTPGLNPEVAAGFGNFPVAANASLSRCAAESDNSWVFTDSTTHRIFRWSSAGLAVIAGNRVEGFSGDGGPATQASINSPAAIAVDSEGSVIFNDDRNDRLRIIRPDGRIFSVSGSTNASIAEPRLTEDGLVSDARFSTVNSIVREANGDLLIGEFSTVYRFTRQPFPSPSIQPGSAVNSASNQPALSPGALITVYGANLALETRAANFAPLLNVLGGGEILLNNQALPVVFASPGQMNVQIPPAFPLGPAKLKSRVDGKLSAEIDVNIAAAGPGIFVYGNNRAVAQNQDGAINGEGSPEAPGRYAVLYITGIGATDNAVASGALSPASPLARATLPFELRVGDAVANVLFVGLTPGFIGLGQVNFEVPSLAAGDHAITLRIAGVLSNAPLFAVAAP